MSGKEFCLKFGRATSLAAFLAAFAAGLAGAQQPADDSQAPAAADAPKALRIGSIMLSGSLRGRAENWNWFETTNGEGDYTFGTLLLRLSLGQKGDRSRG